MDLNQLAKRIVDDAIGEIEPAPEIDEKKKAANEKQRLDKVALNGKKLNS